MHSAAKKGCDTVIKYLVTQKADSNIQDNDEVSILDYTIEGENIAHLSLAKVVSFNLYLT